MYLCVDLYWATLDSHILPAGLQGHGLGDMLHDFVSLQGWAQASNFTTAAAASLLTYQNILEEIKYF